MKTISQRSRTAALAASRPALIVFSLLLLALAPRVVFGQG
jgi:hypothetical protein